MRGEASTPDKYIFSTSGPSAPSYLTSIDWSDPHYRTSVTASLIKGVSILEKDRQKNRESQANSWWEFFHFSLLKPLIDESDSSIYGAIFEYTKTNLFNDYMNIPHSKLPPRYVIVFRGTILRSKSIRRDLKLDFRCILNNLYKSKRVWHAIQEIENHVATHGNEALWLAGYSLGAAIALLVGKIMIIRNRISLDAYIFNPPISAVPLEKLTHRKIRKFLFRFSKNLIRYCTSKQQHPQLQINEDKPNIASWEPYIYLNPADWISAAFIGYFDHKNIMNAIGAGKMENRGVNCGTSLDLKCIHRLISTDVTINKNNMNAWKAHKLDNWWESDPARRANWQTRKVRPIKDDIDMFDTI